MVWLVYSDMLAGESRIQYFLCLMILIQFMSGKGINVDLGFRESDTFEDMDAYGEKRDKTETKHDDEDDDQRQQQQQRQQQHH